MRQFDIYTHHDGDAVAIKKGWSWPAFLFGFFWALFKGLWAWCICIIAINAIMYLGFYSAHGDAEYATGAFYITSLPINIFLALKGNNVLRSKALNSGYKHKRTAFTNTPSKEAAKYIRERF